MSSVESLSSAGTVRKVAVCARVALGGGEVAQARHMYTRTTVRRRLGRRVSRGRAALVWMLAPMMALGALTGCSSSSRKPVTSPTTEAPSGSTASSTTDPSIGQQAFSAYQHAFGVIADIAGSPTGRSTDPRLRQALTDPFYSEVVQEINVYRLRDEVVRGTYSFANFHLDNITADGRVIFTDCQTNSQAIYDAKTGAQVGNAGTSRIPEQVVAYRSSPSSQFRIADDNQGSAVAAARDACAA